MDDAIRTDRLTKYYGGRKVVDHLDLRFQRDRLRTARPQRRRQVHHTENAHGHGSSRLWPHRVARRGCRNAIAAARSASPTWPRAIRSTRHDHPSSRRLHDLVLPNADRQLWSKSSITSPCRRKRRSAGCPKGSGPGVAGLPAPDPELLILDDPTLGLDTNVRRDFLESMIQIIQRRGRTILFSSHVLGDVERVADRVGVMIDGVLRVDCPAEHFKSSVRKVVAEFDGEPPELPLCPGLLGDWRVGTRANWCLSATVRPTSRSRGAVAARVEIVELNLEDAFIEFTRGPRRSLPIFSKNRSQMQGGQADESIGVEGAA